MKAKHTFKYTYEEGCEDFSPLDVTFEVPGDATITQMLYNFQCYLKACGFVFDGSLEIIDDEALKDIIYEEEPYVSPTVKSPSYWDTQPSSICSSDKHNITAEDPKKLFPQHGDGLSTTSSSLDNEWTKAETEKKIKEWNEGIARLDNEQKKKANEDARKMSDLHYEATKEVVKNNWIHGMCNPPTKEAKRLKNEDWADSLRSQGPEFMTFKQ